MQFNPELLNEMIAPGIAEFVGAEIPDLRYEFEQSSYWLSNHHLNHIFGPNYKDSWKQWNINLLLRAQAQFSFYHQAFDETKIFLSRSSHHNPAVSSYFRAVSLWEASFINFQIFIDLYNKALGNLDKKAFSPGDGSDGQRAYDIATTIKHWGGRIKSLQYDEQHTIPLWLSNEGFHTSQITILYSEYASITREIGRIADELEKPAKPK